MIPCMKSLMIALVAVALALPVFADVTGTVTLIGKAPEMEAIDMSGVPECAQAHSRPVLEETVVAGAKGELANAIVYIKSDKALAGEPSTQPAILDQKGCRYEPHVIAVMIGQPIVIKNSDNFVHNVHSLAEENDPFNFVMPTIGEKKIAAQKQPETFQIKCDIHPWMSAWVKVFDHPYFAVTSNSGQYSIKGLPDGAYTILAWQEKYGETQPQPVVVKDGAAKVDFTFQSGAKTDATGINLLANKSCCIPKRTEIK